MFQVHLVLRLRSGVTRRGMNDGTEVGADRPEPAQLSFYGLAGRKDGQPCARGPQRILEQAGSG